MPRPGLSIDIPFDFLLKHRGHHLECVTCYANIGGEFTCFIDDSIVCVKIVCETCGEVLWEESNPKPGELPTFY